MLAVGKIISNEQADTDTLIIEFICDKVTIHRACDILAPLLIVST